MRDLEDALRTIASTNSECERVRAQRREGLAQHTLLIRQIDAFRCGWRWSCPGAAGGHAGGNKSGRRPDITYVAPEGETRGRNVGRQAADGRPVKREREALDDLNGPG